jgi:hypothetical protein
MQLDLSNDWVVIKRFFGRTFSSNLFYSIGSVRNGEPHVTPIGSVLLGTVGQGFFFEIFTRSFTDAGEKVVIVAVDSSRLFWIRSLIGGRFAHPPAIRLYCILGERRPPSEAEVGRWRKRIRLFRWTSGYQKLWGSLPTIREFKVLKAETLELGEMTAQSLRG